MQSKRMTKIENLYGVPVIDRNFYESVGPLIDLQMRVYYIAQ